MGAGERCQFDTRYKCEPWPRHIAHTAHIAHASAWRSAGDAQTVRRRAVACGHAEARSYTEARARRYRDSLACALTPTPHKVNLC